MRHTIENADGSRHTAIHAHHALQQASEGHIIRVGKAFTWVNRWWFIYSLGITMSVDGRLESNDGLLRVQSFAHLLRDAEERIIGEQTTSSGEPRAVQKLRPGKRP